MANSKLLVPYIPETLVSFLPSSLFFGGVHYCPPQVTLNYNSNILTNRKEEVN